jgi:hypothetical protein
MTRDPAVTAKTSNLLPRNRMPKADWISSAEIRGSPFEAGPRPLGDERLAG